MYNKRIRILFSIGLSLAAASVLLAEDFKMPWYAITGGGATSTTGGNFELGGAIGQPTAGAMTGGDFTVTGGFWPVTAPPQCPGDLNCDGKVNFDDIDPFVLALSGQPAYYALYPDCNWLNADCNGDGKVDFNDIDAFVALLSG